MTDQVIPAEAVEAAARESGTSEEAINALAAVIDEVERGGRPDDEPSWAHYIARRALELSARTSDAPVIPGNAVEAAAKAVYHTSGRSRQMPYSAASKECAAEAKEILEAAAPYMLSLVETNADELAAEYRRGYRDGLADRKQVTVDPREWEPGDPVE